MAYKVIILYQLYMPSYFLGTFTEYPYDTCHVFRLFQFPSVPYAVHVVGVVEGKDITVEQVFRPTPGTYVEVAHQPFMLQRVAGGIERIKFGHVAPRPVRRQVTEISVFAGVTGMDATTMHHLSQLSPKGT